MPLAARVGELDRSLLSAVTVLRFHGQNGTENHE
jgi:hypothetical protein